MTTLDQTTASTPTPIRLPWSLIGAVLVVDVALYMYSQGNPLVPVLGLALLLTRVVNLRIPHASWLPWVIRVVAYGFIQMNMPKADGNFHLYDPATISLIGMIWNIEAVIQAWRERPWGNPPGASVILLSAMSYIAATTIGEDSTFNGAGGQYVVYLSPLYVLLLTLSIRDLFAARRRSEDVSLKMRRRLIAIRISGLGLALILGFACWLPIHLYRQEITLWGNNLFQNRPGPEPTGLSTAPALSDMFNGQGSPTRVLRLIGYHGDPHLHGISFDTYSNNAWLPQLDRRQTRTVTPTVLKPNAPGRRDTVYGFTDNLQVLLAPLNAAGIDPPENADVEIADGPTPVYESEARSPYQYTLIESNSQTTPGLFNDALTPDERARCLDVPKEIVPAVRKMAERIGRGIAHNPQAKIDAVSVYLMKHYSYSLTIRPGPGDRVSDFLLNQKAAHCEYFASSAVILLRCLGVPARYVTGYYAHESEGDATVVRQRDSHAWAEAWIDGPGWVTVDATPGGGLPGNLYKETPLTWRIGEWVGDRVAAIQHSLSRFTPLQLSLGIAGIAAMFYGLRWLFVRYRRSRTKRSARPVYETQSQALQSMASRFEAYLATHGVPCPPTRPWQEHIAASKAADEATPAIDREKAQRFVRHYNALRFRKQFDDEQLAATRQDLDQLTRNEAKIND